MNLYWIIGGVSLLTLFGVAVFLFKKPEHTSILTFLVLSLTLIVLAYYAYDTNRIANQTIETNIRPVILRSGYIEKWEDVSFDLSEGRLIDAKPLSFKILKNIVEDVEGEIYVEGKKYKLLFANDITRLSLDKKGGARFAFLPRWGWLETGATISAIYDPRHGEDTKEGDGLLITYKDVEGNLYFTREGKDFSQTVGKGRY